MLKPRKEPIQKRSMATVSAILEGAAQVLERHGTDGFTTNAIAKQAGVSVGTLYQYYPDKNAVAAALSRTVRVSLVKRIADAAETARDQPLREGLRLLVTAALMGDAAHPRSARSLDALEEHLGLGGEGLTIHQELTQLIARFLTLRIPGLPSGTLSAVADDIIAVTKALADTRLRRQDVIDDEFIERVVALLMELLCGYQELSLPSHS